MGQNKLCPACGHPLPADAPRGLCPDCLLALGKEPLQPANQVGSQPASGRRLADYQLMEEVARGGMGVVFKARQLSLDRTVAVKMILAGEFASLGFVERFRREAHAAARLRHPNIVGIHEVGEAEGRPFFSMDLIEGPNLAEAMIRHPLTEFRSQIAPLVAKLARAVHYAHEQGVLHRDLKPSNILLDAQGEPHLTDFGLAKLFSADFATRTAELTATGEALGSPNYMPPEQVAPQHGEAGPASDIYALGAILFHLLTGRPPHVGDSIPETLVQIGQADPVSPRLLNPRVPRDLETICLKCLEKDPRRRYATALALAEDLDRFSSAEPILARPVSPLGRLGRACRRRPLVMGLAAVVALLGMALVVGGLVSLAKIRAALEASRLAHAEASRHERRARERLDQVLRLSDIKRLRDLLDQAEALWPCLPERIPAMEDWLDRAGDLAKRLELHTRTLNELRRGALPSTTPGSPVQASDAWRFADATVQWQHDTLAELVASLEHLKDPSPRIGAIASVQERLAFARTVPQRSIDDNRSAWDSAIQSIANPSQCPKYAGLRLVPQIGLVPLGRDPESGLWEFAHLQTGAIPSRDDRGNLVLTEVTGLIFVLLPGGSFRMGAMKPASENAGPNSDPYAQSDEGPVHEVTLAPFFISKYEMTQGQWLRFTGENPSLHRPGFGKPEIWGAIDLTHPVEQVSWESCVLVLQRLGLALPTEAQWEYAARAGTTTIWWTGNDRESLRGAANLADRSAARAAERAGESPPQAVADWPDFEDGYPNHAPVGRFRPNPFGLFDVHGNVFEWCRDRMGGYELEVREGDGERLAPETEMRVFRGGGYAYAALHSRSAGIRVKYPKNFLYSGVGLRPSRRVDSRPH